MPPAPTHVSPPTSTDALSHDDPVTTAAIVPPAGAPRHLEADAEDEHIHRERGRSAGGSSDRDGVAQLVAHVAACAEAHAMLLTCHKMADFHMEPLPTKMAIASIDLGLKGTFHALG